MTTFKDFRDAVSLQLLEMEQHDLFTSNATRDELWSTYLNSFPEGSNPMFRERTEHDCNCCKQFIRSAGNALAIIDGDLVSAWDINVGGHYQVVADAMSALVKTRDIENIFLVDSKHVGTDTNDEYKDGNTITWTHFYHEIDSKFVVPRSQIATLKGRAKTNHDVLLRSLDEITSGAVEVVEELIEQNSLYRGEEHLGTVKMISALKAKYDDIGNRKDHFAWQESIKLGGVSSLRNTVIGTLLVDLSNNVELEKAVRMFENKVAPTNYKRPKALITKRMIDNANKTVQELGIEDSLYRRYATKEDISINEVLFANRPMREAAGVFDAIKDDVVSKKPSLSKVTKMSVNDFLENVVPKAESIEVYLENKHTNNLVNLIAPVHADTKNILRWGNNFSWSYNGEVTDSIKERVKSAGGSVTGDLRCSLAWSNSDDLDMHIYEPDGNHIYYGNRTSKTGGKLDVDMNNERHNSVDPVENITWPKKERMKEGEYVLKINNYSKRGTANVGFVVEIEFAGEILTFNHPKGLSQSETVKVATFNYTQKDGLKLVRSIGTTSQSKEIWGVNTNNFHKVSMIMNSPNRWDGATNGNKHLFFMLDKCSNPDKARGLYNEFLSEELKDHRKVFEVLGSKLKTEKSTNQLAGVGFSSTQNNSVLCKVQGAFNRTIEIEF